MCKDVTKRRTKFASNNEIFMCPICREKMSVYELKEITCSEGHCFNIANKGYINFLLKAVKTDYDEDMFHSRNIIHSSGFFDPLLGHVSNTIMEKIDGYHSKGVKILDAGCGDGSHIGKIVNDIRTKTDADIQGFGVDISKEGILMASKQYFNIVWCVADLTNLPFMDTGFDVILNILSPANYDEFYRTLKDDGILIKVVPGPNYLKELRDIFYQGTGKSTYSNDEVVELFGDKFKIINIGEIGYTHKIDREELIHLIRMTPLSWAATEGKIQKALDMKISNISVDFTVIIGQNKE